MSERLVPTMMIALQFAAAWPYFIDGDWRRGAYWLAASVLTFTVTW